jgi:hypothetical protein
MREAVRRGYRVSSIRVRIAALRRSDEGAVLAIVFANNMPIKAPFIIKAQVNITTPVKRARGTGKD